MERHGTQACRNRSVELNEAFASQVLAVLRQLGLPDDGEHVNPHGGAIALGHPLGMSGARLAMTAVQCARDLTGCRRAVATMCIGVGQGIAVLIERVWTERMAAHRRVLILGGARSGKSRLRAGACRGGRPDARLRCDRPRPSTTRCGERIARHSAERDADGGPGGAPRSAGRDPRGDRPGPRGPRRLPHPLAVERSCGRGEGEDDTEAVLRPRGRTANGPLVLVSNEVGHGIVPAHPSGEPFRDAQGRLNQAIAATCDAVILVAAGCATLIKPAPPVQLTLA